MTARRLMTASALISFGILLGAFGAYLLLPHPASNSVARSRALNILNSPAPAENVADTPIVKAVRKIAPAVVNIDTVGSLQEKDDQGHTFYVDREVRGKGSGVVLSADGYIITNDHVIDGAKRIRVTFASGQWYYASLIGRDPAADLAVLRVPASHLLAIKLGDSNNLQVGEWCIAVGNPLGLGSTVTVGVVSAIRHHNLELDGDRELGDAIQTDAPINRGNSGGALADVDGQLIGINTAILSSGPEGGSIGLGFAIPVNTVRRIAKQLIAEAPATAKPVRTVWIGVEAAALPENLSRALALKPDEGTYVVQVEPQSPASLAGLQEGDVLLSLDGKALRGVNALSGLLKSHHPGDKVILKVLDPDRRTPQNIVITLQAPPTGVPLAP